MGSFFVFLPVFFSPFLLKGFGLTFFDYFLVSVTLFSFVFWGGIVIF